MTTAIAIQSDGIPSPFALRRIQKPPWWKFWQRGGEMQARQEIENLLAGTQPAAVGRAAVAGVLHRRGLAGGVIEGVLRSLYRQAAQAFLQHMQPEASGREYLTDLRDTLSIGEDAKTEINAALVVPVLQSEFTRWVDGAIRGEDTETTFDTIVRVFDVPHDVVVGIHDAVRTPVMEAAAKEVLAQHTISPQDVERLSELASRLHVELSWSESTKPVLRAGLQMWALENGGPLPVVDVGSMQLQKGEVCHFCEPSEWLEARTVRVSAGNVGYTYRLGSGFTYRTPRVQLASAHHEVLTPIESGFLYITDKRVIFTGQQRNATFKVNSLLGFTQYSDGVQVQKTSGRNPVFTFASHANVAGLVLGRVLDQGHSSE